MDPSTTGLGLYDARHEHDACGVALVAELRRGPNHELVDLALTRAENLEHRGASGAEPETGDGAGILLQVPDAFLAAVAGFDLPAPGRYATGIAFLPADAGGGVVAMAGVDQIAAEEGLRVLGWREVPVDLDPAGAAARRVAPHFSQVFVAPDPDGPAKGASGDVLERLASRAQARRARPSSLLLPLAVDAHARLQGDAHDRPAAARSSPTWPTSGCVSALALVHSRFSTNTFPSWPLAHPYRYIAHNGEINTVRATATGCGPARRCSRPTCIPGDLDAALPDLHPGGSDSASFDEVLELLHLGGRSLPHAVLMMIPEAWENHQEMDPARRAFYQFHSTPDGAVGRARRVASPTAP